MKTWRFAMAVLACWFGSGQGYAQQRSAPGSTAWDGQAPSELHAFPPSGDPVGTFTRPAAPPPASSPPVPAYAGGGAPSYASPEQPALMAPDPTREYLVSPAQGPWMICVTYYSGPSAPDMAVQLVQELRTTYKLPAYIFNHGAEERRKEMERVKEVVQKQREYLKQMNVIIDPTMKIRVPHVRIEEQCAVLIGGYSTMEAARHQLDAIKTLKSVDPKRIKLQNEVFLAESDKEGKLKMIASASKAGMSPFLHGFVVRNPAVPAERPADHDAMDLALLQKLNAGEPFSLLQCPKKYTLAISQLQTPTVVQSQSASSSFLDKLGLGGNTAKVDAAAQSAHSLAELLRKWHQEAYVLHTRFSSVVTVGSYDSPDDPRMKHDQEQFAKLQMQLPPVVKLFPQPMPMPVPR